MARESLLSACKVIRVVVAVSLGEHFYGHAKIASCLPQIGTGLHQPSRRGVAKNVGGHIVAKSSIGHHVGESLSNVLYRFAVPFDGKTLPLTFPAPKVREKAIRQRDRGLAFFRLSLAWRTPVEYSVLKIDPAASRHWFKGSPTDSTCPRSGVERDQNESGDVLARPALRWLPLLDFAVSQSGPNQPRGL
jgi:hypothetical protein